jgi:threonine/homoserine/homoserine lactone efflux protein
MPLFLEGIGIGLVLAAMLGPIFVVLMHSSIKRGSKAGFAAASGIWISDLSFILLSYLFVSKLISWVDNDNFTFWSSLIGGLILLLFGIVTFVRKSNFNEESLYASIPLKEWSAFFIKGIFVNTANPFTFIFWIGVMASNVIGRNLSLVETIEFVGAIFLTIVFTDSLKVLLANRIRHYINQRTFSLISKVAGIGLIGFGVYLLYLSYSSAG